jgi:hypothetical protein
MWLEMLELYGLREWTFPGRATLLPAIVRSRVEMHHPFLSKNSSLLTYFFSTLKLMNFCLVSRPRLHRSPWIASEHVVSHSLRFFHKHNRSSPSLAHYAAKIPTKEQHSWKRIANQIKKGLVIGPDTSDESVYSARLRATHDHRDAVEKIEDELMEEMAGALGRSGTKCDVLFLLLENQGKRCDEVAALISDAVGAEFEENKVALQTAVTEFNRLRHDAENARRELIIHRQAVGFRQSNYEFVESHWPLPPRRLVEISQCEGVASARKPRIPSIKVVHVDGVSEEAAKNLQWRQQMDYLARK